MENTGERHIIDEEFTDISDYYIHLLHIASYEFALKYVINKKVLDYGCGSGYGAHMIAQKAESVLAVDISDDAISYANNKYKSDNLLYTEIKNANFQKYDVIISFQVIEHVPSDREYLKILKSMLNTNGILLLTTPNRIGRLFRFQKPWNIYHLKEYSASSITKLLKKYFDDFEVLGITAVPELVMPEIIRRKKQKIITLPATLSFYPKLMRIFLLNLQSKIYKIISLLLRKKKNKESKSVHISDPLFLKYSSKDIKITEISEYTTDLFIICKSI